MGIRRYGQVLRVTPRSGGRPIASKADPEDYVKAMEAIIRCDSHMWARYPRVEAKSTLGDVDDSLPPDLIELELATRRLRE